MPFVFGGRAEVEDDVDGVPRPELFTFDDDDDPAPPGSLGT
jgi:hypothetical protein